MGIKSNASQVRWLKRKDFFFLLTFILLKPVRLYVKGSILGYKR